MFGVFPHGKYHMLPSGELLIHRVDEADNYHSYQCRAINHLTATPLLSVGRARFSVSNHPTFSAPRALDTQIIMPLRKDHSIVVPCHVEGNPPPSFRWYREEMQQLKGLVEDERIFGVNECLVILHADDTDSGHWVCVANNSAGVERIDFTLQVITPLSVTLQPAAQVTADIGSRVELRCVVTGGGVTQRIWLKDGHIIVPATSAQDQFVIHKVQREDAGMYQCLLRGETESAQSSVQIVLGSAYPQLVYKFIQQTLQNGPPVSLKCIATGNPTPHITWQLDGLPLPSNTDRFLIGQYVTLHGDVVSHVNISNVQVEDGGIYKCTASNIIGETSHSAAMRIYGPPYVRPMPNVSAVAGEALYTSCPVAGYPIDSIIWEKDGRRLPVNRRQRVFPNGTLLLENVQRDSDSGEYRCVAENKQGRSSSQRFHLSVIVPPRITLFTFPTDLHVGDRVGVQCFVTKGDLPLDIQWLKDGGPPDSDVTVQQIGQYTSSLSIESLAPRHAGSYTCVATNSVADNTHSSTLLVNVPPRWVLEPKDSNASRDSFIMFNCQADGFPAPTLIWRRIIGRQPSDYQDLTGKSRGIQVFSNGTLIIRKAMPEHQGQYLCEATNGIGAGLSATVSLVVHNPPEFEVKSAQASVRRGASQTLECQAQGDQPMTITWHRENQLPMQLTPRYVIKESVVKGGILSILYISSSSKLDSGAFLCIATNPFGRAERTVHLQVQDAPGRPKNLRVVDVSSRGFSFSWFAPSDDRSPILQYVVQYRQENGLSDEWEKVSVNTELSCVLRDLAPATKYAVRVVAENELGAGEPSEPILVQTDGEAPAGEPQNVVVTATASDQLRITWTAPLHHLWNGEILGYYVGYRDHGLGRLSGFNFTTVLPQSSGAGLAVVKGLKKFRQYGVVIQAFNEKGPGPMATEIVTQTLEDVPSAPPVEIKCEAQSSQSLLVKWQPPPLPYQNGLIQGYRIYYENMIEWPSGHIEAETKVTTELSIELYGLQKYGNYSIIMWAFTQVGDGVKSQPFFCMTDEDVPEAPAGIKVVVGSPTSLIVSWLEPLRANGKLTSYTLYSRVLEAGRERDSNKKKLPPLQTYYQSSDLRKGEAYEYWVTAFTRAGEGQSTQVVYATISSRVPASIISFGKRMLVKRRSSIVLACLAVGQPPPQHTWTTPSGGPPHDHGFSVSKDGALEISDIQRQHQGNYTCFVSNGNGSDQIIYDLLVLVPPSAPVVGISSMGPSWLFLQWSIVDTGGSAVRGFIVNYRKQEPGEWEERPVSRDSTSYRLTGLTCGTEYHIQVMAFNAVGSGAPSPIVVAKTDGNKPGQPSQAEFIDPNSTSVMLHMKAWHDNGCPILSFSVEYREGSHHEWITVGNDVQARDTFLVVGLWPGMQYTIKVKATNSAGSTVAEYRVTTLYLSGVTLGPDSVKSYPEEQVPAYMEAGYLVPLCVCLLAILSLIAAITICIRRKNEREVGRRNQTEAQAMVALDNKQNLAQREQYYAALHKRMSTPVRDFQCIEKIPEYPDDISPYATFHVAGTERPSSPANMQSFVYHDNRLAAMETMQLKSMCYTMGEDRSPTHRLKPRRSLTDELLSAERTSEEQKRAGICRLRRDSTPRQGSPILRSSARPSVTWNQSTDSAVIGRASKHLSTGVHVERESRITSP